MSQPSSGGAPSSSEQKSPDVIITKVNDKIGQLRKSLEAQWKKDSPRSLVREILDFIFLKKLYEAQNELQKAERDLKYDHMYMPRAVFKLKYMGLVTSTDLENLEQWFHEQAQSFHDRMEKLIPLDGGEGDMGDTCNKILEEVHSFNEILASPRLHIVSLLRTSNSHNSDAQRSDATKKFDDYFLVGEKKQRDMKEQIRKSPAFNDFYEDFLGVFKTLDRKTKLCLLCFSALPEDAVMKKRALLHWWIGEGFTESHDDANKVLKNLVTQGFIQPELKNRRLVGFKMDRLVRPVAVRIAEKLRFLSFDRMGAPNEDFSWSRRLCLVERGKDSSRRVLMKMQEKLLEELERLHTIFNVNDHYPDFKKLWFSKLKNLNVLCLGGWQGLDRPHIEVEGTEFLDDLKIMKHLKLLSLQGISRITELPKSVCELNSLLILDLKACHNLEVLPKNLKALKNLTHLDMSDCYMLDHIPEGLGSLKELRVLKGFLVGDPASKNQCRLEDLAQLKKLRKLSINTARKDFPIEDEVSALKSFDVLENLTLTWRGKSSTVKAPGTPPAESEAKATRTAGQGKGQNKGKSPAHPSEPAQATQPGTPGTPASASARQTQKLLKLELQCFPGTVPPKWLMEKGKLKPKKKLYISGGNLQSLCKVEGEVNKWSVKILRLKYLKGLKMDWSELKNSFKKLVYLEKVQCPRLTLFPCDEDGLWLKPMEVKDLEELGLTWSFLNRRPANMQISPSKEKSGAQNGK